MKDNQEKIPAKIKLMQRFFKVAGEIAPGATLPILVKLLFTPQKRSMKPPHLEVITSAERFKLRVSEFKKPKSKLNLWCYRWGRGDKLVILVHGWNSKAMDFYKLIPVLTAKGYQVVAFDGPAHGLSEGESTHLMHFRDVLYEMIQKVGMPYAIIGHSMGGGAAAHLLMEYDIRVQRLALLATPAISKRYFENIFTFMQVPAKMQKLFFKGMQEQLHENIDDYNLIERKEPIKADEILVIYDPHDEVVPGKEVKEFIKSRPEMKRLEMKNVGHNGIIKSKEVFNALLEFLK
jgi:pimeloyl-ACP methyl ester carboxylesterase